jgi:hypothetical protein
MVLCTDQIFKDHAEKKLISTHREDIILLSQAFHDFKCID